MFVMSPQAIGSGLAYVFIQNLQRLMDNKGMNQQRLADETGLSKQAISKIMGGTRQIKWSTLERLAQAFNISPSELIQKHEPPA